jgi:cell fate regulator YaaT (PSP1 superfamily)
MKVNVVGVRFREADKIYYFAPCNLPLHVEDRVIVETSNGKECGRIVKSPFVVNEEEVVLPLKQVVRLATDADLDQVERNKQAARQAMALCSERITEHGLDMRLIETEYTFDRTKLTFHFSAEQRVDFRQLVRDLASIFHTRIELHQIQVRDRAKLVGGIGPCGRILCCSTWISEFDPISIQMAKNQRLSLNPSKISGVCGKLKCCLKFESENYEELVL